MNGRVRVPQQVGDRVNGLVVAAFGWPDVMAAIGRLPGWAQRTLSIAAPFVVAWIVARSAAVLARRLVRLAGWARRSPGRPARRVTIEGLVRDLIRVVAFGTAAVVALAGTDLVDGRTLVWGIGLLSAGIGLGARPVISDTFSGLTFILSDRFTVGEKVSLLGAAPGEVEGTVERVSLSALHLRAPSGELLVVPNGEVRVVRNFSRGLFSSASVRIRVPAARLGRTLERLDEMWDEVHAALPELIERWQVVSEDGLIGHDTQLLVVTKARFGTAAGVRPRLLALLHAQLADADVSLAD